MIPFSFISGDFKRLKRMRTALKKRAASPIIQRMLIKALKALTEDTEKNVSFLAIFHLLNFDSWLSSPII